MKTTQRHLGSIMLMAFIGSVQSYVVSIEPNVNSVYSLLIDDKPTDHAKVARTTVHAAGTIFVYMFL